MRILIDVLVMVVVGICLWKNWALPAIVFLCGYGIVLYIRSEMRK